MTPRERNRGQSMVEFALIAPVFFLLVFGIVEFGLLMFDVAATRYVAGEAAKAEAYGGNSAPKCIDLTQTVITDGCEAMHGGDPNYACDADCLAMVAIHNSALGSTSLEKISWVEIRNCPASACPNPTCTDNIHTVPSGCNSGTFNLRSADDTCPPPTVSGTCNGFPPSSRSTTAATADYLQVTINYQYDWKTGLLKALHNAPVDLNATFMIRVEPQKY